MSNDVTHLFHWDGRLTGDDEATGDGKLHGLWSRSCYWGELPEKGVKSS